MDSPTLSLLLERFDNALVTRSGHCRVTGLLTMFKGFQMPNLFKSRRFLSAFIGLVVALLTTAIPELTLVRDEIFILIGTTVFSLIFGYTAEDVATARAGAKAYAERQNGENPISREVFDLLREALAATPAPQAPAPPGPEIVEAIKSK